MNHPGLAYAQPARRAARRIQATGIGYGCRGTTGPSTARSRASRRQRCAHDEAIQTGRGTMGDDRAAKSTGISRGRARSRRLRAANCPDRSRHRWPHGEMPTRRSHPGDMAAPKRRPRNLEPWRPKSRSPIQPRARSSQRLARRLFGKSYSQNGQWKMKRKAFLRIFITYSMRY